MTDTRMRALIGLTLVALVGAAFMVFVYAPPDSVEGSVQRIFYLHLAAAMAAYACFGLVLVGGVIYLLIGERESSSGWLSDLTAIRADRLARAGAGVAFLFTTIVLVAGSLWAKPIWGTYWTWDARLTATLVLWLMLGAYFMVREMSASRRQAARLSSVVGILAAVDVPIVHFSVTWWRTIHPPLTAGGPGAMVPAMWWALVASLVAVGLLALTLLVASYRLESARDRAVPT